MFMKIYIDTENKEDGLETDKEIFLPKQWTHKYVLNPYQDRDLWKYIGSVN